MERDRIRRAEALIERKNHAQELENRPPGLIIQSTAEPRPNAYIPEELGLPKPYGALAPFKPTIMGTNMRHIRKPVPQDVQL